ncbi:hypothetical protein ACHRV5_02515 [Flavobacterium sp. FlaQc-52]|jgi:hypothetical protein|uniref:hypothetical protein n=1 Tax=Flavobacterium sp. FlaQc-52 TaxID=3374185 RepID=UPI003757C900
MALNLNDLIASIGDENDERFPIAKAQVQEYLSTLQTVKIFIADSRNFGHQSSSINILFNLIRLGCNAVYTVVYENRNALNKLKVLLPINPDNVQSITLPNSTNTGNVTVNFKFFNEDPVESDLALTGGYDNSVRTLTNLNAKYIIELQPYNWYEPGSQNVIYIKETDSVVNLDQEITNFNKQAFYIEDPTRDDVFWAKFPLALPSWLATVKLTTALLDLYGPDKNFLLTPLYGINTASIDPILALFNMCCGVSYQQSGSGGDKRKAVIVSFSPTKQTGQNNDVDLGLLKTLIDTGKYGTKGPIFDAGTFCNKYRESSNLAARVKYYSGTISEQLTAAIEQLEEQQILVVQIGPVPAPIFNYTYYMANLPFVFEGQNTATLAMNFGRPYLHLTVPSTYDEKTLFPAIPTGNSVNNNLNGNIATMISSRLSVYPRTWADTKIKLNKDQDLLENRPSRIGQLSPAYVLGQYAYDALQADPKNRQTKYFTKIGTYFHDEKYDKLLDALIYLNNNIINP